MGSRQRRMFIWLLPLVWSAIFLLSLAHPGGENAGLLWTGAPGIWILYICNSLAAVLAAGAAVVAAGGLVMDWVAVPVPRWCGAYLVLTIVWAAALLPLGWDQASNEGRILHLVLVIASVALYTSWPVGCMLGMMSRAPAASSPDA